MAKKNNARAEMLKRRKRAEANKKRDDAERRAGIKKQIKASKKPKK